MPVSLNLYTREGCHLCDDMEYALPAMATELGFTTDIIQIDNNAELERIYGDKVPVLVLGDDIICESFLNKIALSEAITRFHEKHS